MPIRIIQVTNVTNHTLHCHNIETGHNILIVPKTEDGTIPTSDYHDDTIPLSDKNHIIVKLDDRLVVEITDHNGELHVVGPINGTGERADAKFDTLKDGVQSVLREDEDGRKRRAISRYWNTVMKTSTPLVLRAPRWVVTRASCPTNGFKSKVYIDTVLQVKFVVCNSVRRPLDVLNGL